MASNVGDLFRFFEIGFKLCALVVGLIVRWFRWRRQFRLYFLIEAFFGFLELSVTHYTDYLLLATSHERHSTFLI